MRGSIYGTYGFEESASFAASNSVYVSDFGLVWGSVYGVRFYGSGGEIQNHGEAYGANAGMYLSGSDYSDVFSSGQVSSNYIGICANGSNNYIRNTGTVTGRSFGVYTNGDHNVVSNSGTILGDNAGYRSDTAAGETNTLHNFGTVAGSSGTAIT